MIYGCADVADGYLNLVARYKMVFQYKSVMKSRFCDIILCDKSALALL